MTSSPRRCGRGAADRVLADQRLDADVVVEPLRQAAIRIEHDRTDEGAGTETRARAESRPASCGPRERAIGVVAHAVLGGSSPVKRLVCAGKRQRRDRRRLIEDDAFASEPLEMPASRRP